MPTSAFEDAVSRLMDAVEDSTRSASLVPDLQLIRDRLARQLRSRFVAASDVDDIVDETLFLFVRACKKGKILRDRSPAGYLNAITKHQMISRLRERHDPPAIPPDYADDDPLELVLDATAAVTTLHGAFSIARSRDDVIALRVTAAWLDLAARLGRSPTSREVGRESELSHTTVLAALARLRGYLPGGTTDAY